MKNEGRSMLIVTLYILVMLIVCVVAITNVNNNNPNEIKKMDTEDEEPIKEINYLPVYPEKEPSESVEEAATVYHIQSYQGMLGVFSESGALLRIIDINIKSLPKADRDLLEKGFSVEGESALLSIFEDYTG